jgi:hypothetical protein
MALVACAYGWLMHAKWVATYSCFEVNLLILVAALHIHQACSGTPSVGNRRCPTHGAVSVCACIPIPFKQTKATVRLLAGSWGHPHA